MTPESDDGERDRGDGDTGIDRRVALRAAGKALALQVLALGCARTKAEVASDPDPGQVSIALADLPLGRRVVVVVAGNPAEVMRTEEGIRGRSLRCTHTGCVVKWREDLRLYVCPCHEGRYREDGEVLEGPPPMSLRRVPVRLGKGDRVVVG